MSIWKNRVDINQLNKTGEASMTGYLDIVITEIGDDYLKATMPVDHRTRQPYGLLHGGASAVLSESLGSISAGLCVDFKQYRVVGIDINAKHLKSAKSGLVTGICRPVKIGRTLQVWQTKIFNELDELVCISQLTVMVISHQK